MLTHSEPGVRFYDGKGLCTTHLPLDVIELLGPTIGDGPLFLPIVDSGLYLYQNSYQTFWKAKKKYSFHAGSG